MVSRVDVASFTFTLLLKKPKTCHTGSKQFTKFNESGRKLNASGFLICGWCMNSEEYRAGIRSLVMVWASCCCSPVIYLAVAWLCQRYGWAAWRPVVQETWTGLIIALTVLAIVLQISHIFTKSRFGGKLRETRGEFTESLRLLTRRTYVLMAISEIPVFFAFLLFCVQGDVTPVFGFGLVSMILYAQSHPRSGLLIG